MLGIERYCRCVALPHFERQERKLKLCRLCREHVYKRVAYPLPSGIRMHRDVGDVALIQHVHEPYITKYPAAIHRGNELMLLIAHLAFQLLRGPRTRKAITLDLFDLPDVLRAHVNDPELHQCASAQLCPICASTVSGTDSAAAFSISRVRISLTLSASLSGHSTISSSCT